jgi:tetratricopeptide (TPR) repeat protein
MGFFYAPPAFLLLGGLPVGAHPEIELQIREISARMENDPNDPSLFLRRGELHRIHQDWTAAEADFLHAREIDPELAIVDFHLGRMKLEAGDPAAAILALNRFLATRPDHGAALFARARARVALGQNLEAVRDFTRGLAATPRPIPTYYLERARALTAAGDRFIGSALRGLDEGLERLGRPVTLELEAIELELRRGTYDLALVRVERLAQNSPRREAWLIRRGEILERAGKAPQARQAYAQALEAIDTLPPSRRWNRAVQRLQTQAEAALERLSEAR